MSQRFKIDVKNCDMVTLRERLERISTETQQENTLTRAKEMELRNNKTAEMVKPLIVPKSAKELVSPSVIF